MVKKLKVVLMRKNYRRLIKKSLGSKKGVKIKEINYMSNGKVMIIFLTFGYIKKT